jgi:hypothetical protein
MTQFVNAVDAQASAGYIEIGTSGMAVTIVTITFSKPSFNVATGIATMLSPPKSGVASSSGTQTAAAARIRDGSANDIVTGLTVGTSAADIVLNSTSITNGQTVTLTSATITHA